MAVAGFCVTSCVEKIPTFSQLLSLVLFHVLFLFLVVIHKSTELFAKGEQRKGMSMMGSIFVFGMTLSVSYTVLC